MKQEDWTMSTFFLDVTQEQLNRNTTLRTEMDSVAACGKVQSYYTRIRLQDSSAEALRRKLFRILLEETVAWILQQEQDYFLPLRERVAKDQLEKLICERITVMMPQLTQFVEADMKHYYCEDDAKSIPSWNIEGYLRFSAKKLKWMIRTLLQEIYQAYQEEVERDALITLLQFCVSVQPYILDDVYLTLYPNQFTLQDIWGNDLRQIYLDTLPEEEYSNVSMQDLLLSILMTLLPKTIHLFVEPIQLNEENEVIQKEQKRLLLLLQQIFAERLCVETER